MREVQSTYFTTSFPSGHVLYEMAMGNMMSGVFPEEADYAFGQYKGDDLEGITAFAEKCRMFREILDFVFTRKGDGRFAHSIKQVSISIYYNITD